MSVVVSVTGYAVNASNASEASPIVSAGGNDEIERLAAGGGREVGRMLRLARCDLAETRLQRGGLHAAERPEVRAEQRRLERLRELEDRGLVVERAGRVAEVDVARDRGRLAGAAQDPGDRLVMLLLVRVGPLEELHHARVAVAGRDRLRVEVGREQLAGDEQPRVGEVGRRQRIRSRGLDEPPERRPADDERAAALRAPREQMCPGKESSHGGFSSCPGRRQSRRPPLGRPPLLSWWSAAAHLCNTYARTGARSARVPTPGEARPGRRPELKATLGEVHRS